MYDASIQLAKAKATYFASTYAVGVFGWVLYGFIPAYIHLFRGCTACSAHRYKTFVTPCIFSSFESLRYFNRMG